MDVLQLEGKRVVVTGAASGIGRATCIALAGFGARIRALDVTPAGLESLVADLRAEGADIESTVVDVSDDDQVESAFAAAEADWGGIDIVINVAGIMREQGADVRDISLESWTNLLKINLNGSFLVAQAAARRFIPQGKGTIILVGSGAGVIAPSGSIPYGASKAGVNGLAMTLDQYLAPHGIRVHNFCPGSVDTPLYRRSLEERVDNGAPESSIAPIIAGATSSEGVGRALALLASPLADSLRGNIYTR